MKKHQAIAVLFIVTLIFSSFWHGQSASAIYPTKATSNFGILQISQGEYDVSYTSGATVKVNGTVSKPQQGEDKVTIVFTAPDGSTSGSQVAIAWNGFFQTDLPLDYNSQKGVYTVFASYAQTGIGALAFSVKQVSVTPLQNSNQVSNTTNQQTTIVKQNTPTPQVVTPTPSTPLPSDNTVKIQNKISNPNISPITTSGELKPSDIFSLAKPGTMLIFTLVNSTIKIPAPEFETQQLTNFINTEINQGILNSNDGPAKVQAALDEIARNPDIYLIPTSQYTTIPLGITLEGSGFILNQDGYVVTNAHVVGASNQDIQTELAKQAATIIINSTATSFAQTMSLTENQRSELTTAYLEYVVKNVQLGEIHKNILAVVQNGSDQPSSFTLQVITVGGVIPDKDVAILKMSGGNFSPLPLGDDANLSVGDKLYVLGYPGAATFTSYLSASSYTEPTFTSGVVSAKKTMAGGWSIVQTDATMTHGNSGGPVFDSNGKVIGIATFVSVDPNTGQEVPGLNFVIPSSIIKEFVNTAGTTYIQDYPSMTSSLSNDNTLQTSSLLPHWIKNNARSWANNQISDNEFIIGIQYLIQHNIITIPSTSHTSGSNQIPQWIKNNAKLWADGSLSDNDFLNGIGYLVKIGIIKV